MAEKENNSKKHEHCNRLDHEVEVDVKF